MHSICLGWVSNLQGVFAKVLGEACDSNLEACTLFQTQIKQNTECQATVEKFLVKISIPFFQTKTAQPPYPLGLHIPL